MTNKTSYYAIIPANVRYDKKLIPNAKLLYGEITALCNEKGYCWASNKYFADLYEVSITSISTWIRALKELKYINIELEYREGSKEILHRYIRILTDPMQENLHTPMQENLHTPMQENLKDNTTKNNNTINTTENKRVDTIPPNLEDVKAYCKKRENGVNAEKWWNFYDSKGWMVGKNKMKKWKSCVHTWEAKPTPKGRKPIKERTELEELMGM